MSRRSFTDIIKSSRSSDVYLIRGKDTTNRRAWYYLLVEKTKKRLFENDVKSSQMQLTDYGTIVYSGYGENPPEDIRQKMEDEYGFKEAED